ncbi:hypothetical protein GUJ93_ZPchr0004g38622 [Zizania palustris]|uniref:Uncharacterized protein n=1 Tax=Zizania palustris TaxID=103762 RepID=A0A8J5SKT4_ZIZPA|nr:hypothetical protein GUJ93_ZPchr0004g38622 [Zizania palustris]
MLQLSQGTLCSTAVRALGVTTFHSSTRDQLASAELIATSRAAQASSRGTRGDRVLYFRLEPSFFAWINGVYSARTAKPAACMRRANVQAALWCVDSRAQQSPAILV